MTEKKHTNDARDCNELAFDQTDRVKKWNLVSSKDLVSSGPFTIRRQTFTSPRTGEDYPFITAAGSDWVSVVAVTSRKEVLMVEQYRHGRDIITFELPGGLIDDAEKPEIAAVRELKEETGFGGSSVSLLGKLEPNPAFLDVTCHCYLMKDAQLVSQKNLDASEDLVVHRIPLTKIPTLIGQGVIRHGLAIAGISLLACRTGLITLDSKNRE